MSVNPKNNFPNNTNLETSRSNNNTELLTLKMEKLKAAFREYDKNLDDYIDYVELLQFLDSLMKDGKKFDRNIAKDIFKILDLNGDKKVTVQEFLKTFIGIYDTIDQQIKVFETQLVAEQAKKKELEFSVREFINEPVNEEQLGPNAKFLLEIANIEFASKSMNFKGVRIVVKFDEQVKNTKIISVNSDLFWREKFEFKVKNKSDIIFEVLDIDPANTAYFQSLGIVKFSLGMIANQEEYDVVLEMPDLEDEKSVSAKINAKIQFIWSFYKLYSEKLSKTEENIYNLQLSLQKKRTVLNHLNDPLKIFEIDEELIGNKYKNQKGAAGYNSDKSNSNQVYIVGNQAAAAGRNSALDDISILGAKNKNNSRKPIDKIGSKNDFDEIATGRNSNNLSDKFIDNLDEMINSKINTGRVDWFTLYRNINLVIFMLSLISCFIKPAEFVGIICSLIIHGIYINSASFKLIDKINLFIKILFGNVVYDLTLLVLQITTLSGKSFFGDSKGSVYYLIQLIVIFNIGLRLIFLLSCFLGRRKLVKSSRI